MKKSIETILRAYSAGAYETLEAANAALKSAGSRVLLDPKKNVLTKRERSVTTVGETPEQAHGYGLLSSGTGTLDKVQIAHGVLRSGGNQILPDGRVSMDLTVYIGGQRYSVRGRQLVTWKGEGQ